MGDNASGEDRPKPVGAAGHLATGGLGLILGCLTSAAIFYHHLKSSGMGPRDPFRDGPLGLALAEWALLAVGIPLGAALAGQFLPLGRFRSALNRGVYAFALNLVGLLCLIALEAVLTVMFIVSFFARI